MSMAGGRSVHTPYHLARGHMQGRRGTQKEMPMQGCKCMVANANAEIAWL